MRVPCGGVGTSSGTASAARAPFRVPARALFGGNKGRNAEAERLKQVEWEKQQAILARRKAGKTMGGVQERRAKVSEKMRGDREKRLNPDLEAWKVENAKRQSIEEYNQESDSMGGLPLPMASFGIPRFDGGERWDLRLPYADAGYVDENDQGILEEAAGFWKKLLRLDRDADDDQADQE